MISWSSFIYFALISIVLWWVSSFLSLKSERWGGVTYLLGIAVFTSYILLYWYGLGRAPLRTMGETRLWYVLFLTVVSWLLFLRWRFKIFLFFGALLATVFALINVFKPEIHDATLMPALQSGWFFPHVTIYMLSYAILALATLLSLLGLVFKNNYWGEVDMLVRIGSALLLLGMLMGAIWAKQAWGNYWTWDAKENWALVTWLLYVSYLHVRSRFLAQEHLAVVLLVAAFLALQVTWYGVSYLPSSQHSMHTYTMSK